MDTEKKYISLSQASKLCSYSQEYLSLRARQGKLKAVKLGRNWATTKQWLEDYVHSVKKYKKPPRPFSVKKSVPKQETGLKLSLIIVLTFLVLSCCLFFGQPNGYEQLKEFDSNLTVFFNSGTLKQTAEVFNSWIKQEKELEIESISSEQDANRILIEEARSEQINILQKIRFIERILQNKSLTVENRVVLEQELTKLKTLIHAE